MIATHNVKVNGVWYKVGEEIKEVSSPVLEDATETNEFDELFSDVEKVVETPKKTTKKSTKK